LKKNMKSPPESSLTSL